MINPPAWSSQELSNFAAEAKAQFRKERLEEPLEEYATKFEEWQGVFENLLEATVDLSRLGTEELLEILTDKQYLDAFRYLAGPPISQDDLKTLAEVESTAASRLRQDPVLIGRLAGVVMDGLDRRRFPWISENRLATDDERKAAILASASLQAHQAVQTWRRNEAGRSQESIVKSVLLAMGFVEVPKRSIKTFDLAPANGEFCGESTFGTRRADLVVGLHDGRKAPIECKVSNSEVNSVKRLNNDAAVKARSWQSDFGKLNVVPIAILSGVYKLENLEEAQNRGLFLFWSHRLKDFEEWLNRVREEHQ
ncbi:MAG: XamI family restriction endonuclease [Phycisphaerales bacterium]